MAHRTRHFTTAETPQPQVPEYFEGPIEPNAPAHNSYILLHAPLPPSEFPKVYNTPLSLELLSRAKKWGGIVNFSWFGNQSAQGGSEFRQAATMFSQRGGRLEIPHVSLEDMDQVENAIQEHLQGPVTDATSQEVHIYVCTHGARDCRCGHRGRDVFNALVKSLKSAQEKDPYGPAFKIKIGEVGHVGGHKWAANLLIFPQGEWLGLVKPEDAPFIIARSCKTLEQGAKPLRLSDQPAFPSHWRGRMGLSKEEQMDLAKKC